MKRHRVLALALVILFIPLATQAATFVPTSGIHFWNVDANWDTSPAPFPSGSGASAIIPTPTGPLTIDLGQAITVGFLEIQKTTAFNTTISGANTLTIAGGTSTIANRAGAGTGVSVIDVLLQLNSTLTVEQYNNEQLRFQKSISGSGGLAITRPNTAPAGPKTVVLTAANSYNGPTTFTNLGPGGDEWLIVRLNNANAIPAASTLNAGTTAILEIASGSFTRTGAGGGAGQIVFGNTGRNGFSAIGGTATVNLGATPVSWNAAAFSQLVLGISTSDSMVDFTSPLNINNAGRNIRSYNGTAAVDGRISGNITSAGVNGRITKLSDGVLSFAGNNTYQGGTSVEDGMLRLDSVGALPLSAGLHQVGQGATLGIGTDLAPGDPNADFARNLGANPGDLQLVAIGNGGNQANAGLSAHNGNRSVVFNGGTMLTWGTNFFLSGQNGATTANRNLILSDESADGTLIFKNPIDLNGAGAIDGKRQLTVRNGSADIDAEMSGVLSGVGELVKENTGTLVLSAANTYDGPTSVVRGRLLVNNTSGSGTGSGDVTVEDSATLGGTGSIAGTVTVNSGGHIAPGASIESLEVGGLTLEIGSILDFELGAPNGMPGINNDLLTVLGTTTINGIGAVNLTDAGGLAPGFYTLIDYDGTLAGADVASFLAQSPTGPAGFTYKLIDTGSTIDLRVRVPEPTTLALMSIAAMFVMRRSREWIRRQ